MWTGGDQQEQVFRRQFEIQPHWMEVVHDSSRKDSSVDEELQSGDCLSLEDWIFSVPWEAEVGKEKVYGNKQNSTNLHGRKMWLSWWWRSASCLKLCPTIKYASLGVSQSEMTGVTLSSFSPVTKGIKTMNSFFLTPRKSRNVYLIFLWEKGGSEVLS